MFSTIQEWWTRLKNWTLASTVGAKRETVEAALETEQFRDFAQQMDDFIAENGWRFPQILRGGGKPQDRPDELDFIPNLPGWLDYEIHEWEGPEGKGWRGLIYVKEGADWWVLELERPWDTPEWRLVEDNPIP